MSYQVHLRVPGWKLPLSFVLPLVLGGFALAQLRTQQPYWGGRMNDPSYIYLLSSLNLATFSTPGHIDHPGTPVQLIGALTLRAMHPTATSAALARTILHEPEKHAQAISLILISLAITGSVVAGLWVLARCGRLGAVLAVQAGPLVMPDVLAGYSGVRPEPLLLAWVPLWIAVWILWADGQIDLQRRGTQLAIAVLGGISLATKFTFAPLLIIPLALLPDGRSRRFFSMAVAGSFFVTIAPAWPQLRRIASWVFRLATRDGAYGSGATSLGPREGWGRALFETTAANAGFVVLLIIAATIIAVSWRQPKIDGPPLRSRRLAIATLLAFAAALVMVAKQAAGSTRYLLPAAAATPLLLYGLWHAHAERLSSLARVGLISSVAGTTLAFATVKAAHQLAAVHKERLAAIETQRWVDNNLSGARVFPFFGASSVPFALAQADLYANKWASVLAQTYPGFTCYELWGEHFKRDFSPTPVAPPADVFYLRGAPLQGGVLDDARRRFAWTLTSMWSNRIEAIYRAEPHVTP